MKCDNGSVILWAEFLGNWLRIDCFIFTLASIFANSWHKLTVSYLVSNYGIDSTSLSFWSSMLDPPLGNWFLASNIISYCTVDLLISNVAKIASNFLSATSRFSCAFPALMNTWKVRGTRSYTFSPLWLHKLLRFVNRSFFLVISRWYSKWLYRYFSKEGL